MSNIPRPLDTLLAGEIKVVVFDFDSELEASESIASSDTTCTVLRGVDANPGAVRVGASQVVGRQVLQRVQWQAPAVLYELRCLGVGSTGLRHVVRAHLPTE